MKPLPIDAVLPELIEALSRRGVAVLQAPPGAGKTTRVPPALLPVVPGDIVVLEPRRLAARLSARWVAHERGEKPGETVGYEVRFERVVGSQTRLTYVTEGILERRLLADPQLENVSAVVLDEFHERHLQGDLVLALLRRLRETSRPELRLLVMSATLDAAPVARFLGDAPLVSSEGRLFEVTLEHVQRPDDRPLQVQVASTVRDLVRQGLDGDVLVFLPGAAEIRRALEACASVAEQNDLLVVPLHGDLPPVQQDRAIERSDRRKVILSTNVAETSVTIEGVVAVVDSGLARVAGHDPWSGRPTLDVRKISRASAAQRAGRAGRLRPGRALRLYTKGDHDARPAHELPEITRADLAELVLHVRAMGVADPRSLQWLDAPPAAALDAAEALVRELLAVDASGALTDVGRRMLRFPLPPRIARLLVEAERRGVAEDGCGVAAILAEGRDLYARSLEDWKGYWAVDDAASDVVLRLEQLRFATRGGNVDRERARSHNFDANVLSSIHRVRQQLLRACDLRNRATGDAEAMLRMAILAAYPDRVAKRRAGPAERLSTSAEVVLSNGGTATLADSSVVRTAPWLVAVDARDDAKGRTRVWLASAIEPEWLIELFPDAVKESIEVSFRDDQERVEAIERMQYGRLSLDERPAGSAADERVAELLIERALARGIDAFLPGDALSRLRARIAFVRSTTPDLAERAGLRALDDATLREILIARARGKRSFGELRDEPLLDEIRASIGHAALARLDALAPEQVTLGGWRKVRVEYAPGQPPAIESRLQDFFGSREGPKVADGRVALVLHLLAPNGRDVQVTSDLAGFWVRTYPAVRSELSRRYPRHAWPEDPLTASPPPPGRAGSRRR